MVEIELTKCKYTNGVRLANTDTVAVSLLWNANTANDSVLDYTIDLSAISGSGPWETNTSSTARYGILSERLIFSYVNIPFM